MRKGFPFQFCLTGSLSTASGGGGSGSNLTVQDEGSLIDSNVTLLNFIGADVQAMSAGSGNVSIYIPPPTFASHWTTNDGTTNGTVSDSTSRSTTRISTPTAEGNPFSTNGWAGTNQSTTLNTTNTFTTATGQAVTGFGGNSYFVVTMFDADGTTVLESYTTPSITGDGTNTSGSGFIVVTISSYAADTTRFKAVPSIQVQSNNIFTANSRSGGRFNVTVVMYTDTATDGTGPYTFTQTGVFLDTNPTTPSIGGTVSIAETSGSVLTKHLSGLEYYILNSQFTADVLDIDQLNRNTARTSNNLTVTPSNYGLPTLNHSPFGTGSTNFSGWTNNFDQDNVNYQITSWAITSSNFRYAGTGASISARPRDTWANGASVASSSATILVDTYGTTSTNTFDDFDDENRRQTSDYNTGSTSGNWTSTNSLVSGEAMVYGGKLQVPSTTVLSSGASNANWTAYLPTIGGSNPDYSSLSATSSYFRTIVDTAGTNRSSFSIVFTGDFVSNATNDLANNDLVILIRRRASANGGNSGYNTAFPLYVSGALYNFAAFDDGVTNGQIREASSSGNTVNCTFGGFTCETGFFIEIQIVNTNIKIDSISVTFF